MKSHVARKGAFIPSTGIAYPENPEEHMVEAVKVRSISFDSSYPFLDRSLRGRLRSLCVYAACFIAAIPANRLRYGLKIEGRENLRECSAMLGRGAVTVANHVYKWDFISILDALRWRRLWFPARAALIEGPDAFLVRGIGGIPLAGDAGGRRRFNEALNELNGRGEWIHVFPEGSRWDFYAPIRPFRTGAFALARRWNVPVIPMAFSYRPAGRIRRLLGARHPLVTISIGKPIAPDMSLPPKECRRKLRDECHRSVVELAGIESNEWPPELTPSGGKREAPQEARTPL